MPAISLDSAYEECRQIARHYENFPVGSLLVPKKLRKHFFALYAFMRTADDIADLPHRPSEERLVLLEEWRSHLQEVIAGKEPVQPVFIALADTIKACSLPTTPLERLLEAFEFDAKGDVRFETFTDLRWYTARSADPVGELVLGLFGYHSEAMIRRSDDICSGLQLLNFIQDIREDLIEERYYYPDEDWQLFGLEPSDEPDKERLALLSLFELERVEALLEKGAPLAEEVEGRLKYELRAIIHSARKLVKKVKNLDGNTFSKRPSLKSWERIVVLLQSLVVRVS